MSAQFPTTKLPYKAILRSKKSMCCSSKNTVIITIFAVLLAEGQFISITASGSAIMSCFLCEIMAESLSTEANTFTLTSMYRRCAKMGLMEPVCDQLVDKNAKQIMRLAVMSRIRRTSPRRICVRLKLCDE